MSQINIFGFPKTMKKSKIYQILKSAVFGKRLRCKFWIQDIVPASDSDYVVIVIYVNKKSDATKAVDLLNNFIYYDHESDLQISAVNVTSSTIPEEYDNIEQAKRDREVRQSNRSQLPPVPDNGRSRSPHGTPDVTDLDMEIQLVRKERFLVIEQRKLILEQKRLELLKEFEPSSLYDLEMYAAAIERHTLDNDAPSTPQTVPNRPKVKGTSIPILASRAIIKEINDSLPKRHKVRSFTKPLHYAINRRFMELVEGKGQIELDEILRLYREVYPVETDEALLGQIEAQVKQNTEGLRNLAAKSVKGINEATAKAVCPSLKEGISNSDNVEDEGKIVNDEESKKKESENKEVVTSASFSETELDDWLDLSAPEKDDVQQEDKDVKKKEDVDNLEVE